MKLNWRILPCVYSLFSPFSSSSTLFYLCFSFFSFFLTHIVYVSSRRVYLLDHQQSTHRRQRWCKRVALKKRRWLLDGDDGKAGRYGKMYVSGYSSSSWESSFDSQCLEIIRSRGGPGVATATANHRAKKNFSLYNAHFSVLLFAWAPSRNARDSRWRSRGLVRESTTTKATNTTMAMRARRKLDGEVMGGGEDNVCSGTGEST